MIREPYEREKPDSRTACVFSNLWFAVWALWDGPARAGEWGWSIAPRFGFWFSLLTGWAIPFLFAAFFGAIGGVLGSAAALGSAGEAVFQLFTSHPYKRPVSRMLIDWIPGT